MFYKVDQATGTVSSSPTDSNYVQIAGVVEFAVIERYRAATNDFQGGIEILYADPVGEAAIIAQAPAVFDPTFANNKALQVPTKRLFSEAGDTIKLYNGVTLSKTLKASGGTDPAFGPEGDFPSKVGETV